MRQLQTISKTMTGEQMIHVPDIGPDPGLWVSFGIKVLFNPQCFSQEQSDSDNDTGTTSILGKNEGLWNHLF